MSMFDDLDPDFISSPGPALPLVAARVHAVRKRRMVVAGSVCGAVAVALLASTAFGGGGDNNRVTVAQETTTTVDDTSTTEAPLLTVPTSSTSTSTTVAGTSTTVTLPPETTTTAPETTTTTVGTPANLTAEFDRNRLVIQSGTQETISYTVTNDGDQTGTFDFAHEGCSLESLYRIAWPAPRQPIAWPSRPQLITCPLLRRGNIPGHSSQTFTVTILAGVYRQQNQLVPAPPGDIPLDILYWPGTLDGATLPVNVTPPATPPLTVDRPSEVTTGSGDDHDVDFTITNNLPFPVTFVAQGPCVHGGDEDCEPTFPNSARDLRVAPYAKADVPLWTTIFRLVGNETRMATATVDGVTDLDNSSSGSTALPAGIYHFAWDGEKVKFTVTP